MKKQLFFLFFLAVMVACGNRRLSDAELQHKLDSVYQLEKIRHLKMQGVHFDDMSPFQMFYDSLGIQTLPFCYTEDYMKTLPGFTTVPMAIMTYLELEGRVAPKAIALPETLGSRLVLLAADLEDGQYELWLYSLDSEYFPVDKMLLYQPQQVSETKLKTSAPQEPFFSITSNYEIRLVEYQDDEDRMGQWSVFMVDEGRMFVEKDWE
jgi:hypothetical protein